MESKVNNMEYGWVIWERYMIKKEIKIKLKSTIQNR